MLLRDMIEVGNKIDLNQEFSVDEIPPLIDQIDAEHEAAREAENSTRHIKPIVYFVYSETGRIVRRDFTCVKGDGEIMIIARASLREWTKEIIA